MSACAQPGGGRGVFRNPWLLGAAMSALYALAVVLGFWRVLAPDVVFVAPDAPIAPLGFGEALRQLFTSPPTLQLSAPLTPVISIFP